jgi:hypothetical protein
MPNVVDLDGVGVLVGSRHRVLCQITNWLHLLLHILFLVKFTCRSTLDG